jgi:hypothetical protein
MTALLVLTDVAFAGPVSRDVNDYFALSFRRMRLKDFFVEAPGCNLGVNCEEVGRGCGRLHLTGAVITEPGQLVASDVCGPGTIYELFRNNTDSRCLPNCGMIGLPGPGPNCENTFEAPLLGDLDGDGQPSCQGRCVVDIGDVAAACDIDYPMPPCDLAREVRVHAREDCSPIALDVVPGNGQCDLLAGTYGHIKVRNRGRIRLGAGTTVACSLAIGKATRVSSDGPALVLVPGQGKASFNNMSDVGGECREFKVVTELGPVRFAKHGEFHLDACTLGGTMKLGHDNYLRGRFISGEFLVSNFNSTGGCCEPTTTSTTLATTTTTSTTTITTSTSTTTSSTTSSSNTTTPSSTFTTTTFDNQSTTITSTSITTTTSTTNTTSTTVQKGVCCEDKDQLPWVCSSAPTAEECIASGGVPGGPFDTCRAGGQGSFCDDIPPGPGGCCQKIGQCSIGGLDQAACEAEGGTFVPQAVCLPDGRCSKRKPGGFTRTLGFYKQNPAVVEWILEQAESISACGLTFTNVELDSASSVLEALCTSTRGNQRAQLLRQLVAARLTQAAGGATYGAFGSCESFCANGGSIYDLGGCINSLDAFNNSGDNLPAPFDGMDGGYAEFCQLAYGTDCTVFDPTSCAP